MWSTDELTGLGKMVMNFSALDACVDRLLAGFIAEPSVAEILVAGQFVSWKFEKLQVIARECLEDTEAKTALLDWIKAAKRLNERRVFCRAPLFPLNPPVGALVHRGKSHAH